MEFAVCVATFYEDIAEQLLNGAAEGFGEGVSARPPSTPTRCQAPSSCPWPPSSAPSRTASPAIACLGVVIRGETNHYDHVCAEVASGIQRVQLDTGVPCAFGVITAREHGQAEARAGGDKRDQGRNAAIVAMRMAHCAQIPVGRLRRHRRPETPPPSHRLAALRPLSSRASWPRSVTAAASAPPSATRAATRWSRRGGASTRTSRKSASRRRTGAPGASTSARAA